MATDQKPVIWNLSHEKAVRLLELMRLRRPYKHSDIPNSARLTRGYEEKTLEEPNDKLKIERDSRRGTK